MYVYFFGHGTYNTDKIPSKVNNAETENQTLWEGTCHIVYTRQQQAGFHGNRFRGR